MATRRLLPVLGAALGSVVAAATAQAPTGAPSSPRAVLFAEDFAGSQLSRAHWNVIVTGRVVNNEQQAYVDSADTIAIVQGAETAGAENGALALRPRYRPGFTTADGRAFDFVSGRLESRGKIEFTHGVVEARIKLPAGAGLWPAFWLLGTGRWPETGEIDIMENVGDRTWTNVALHGPGYSGNTPLVARRPFPPPADATGWHVYGVEWTTTGFVFIVDGDVFYRVSRAEVEKYGRWAYDTPKFLIFNFAIGGQYPQSVNKVTTPYPGLPASTVDLLKAGEVEMLVDWVRVTQP
jgi:beta-glucanase (GH16 family)